MEEDNGDSVCVWCLTVKETGNGRSVDSERGRDRLVVVLVLYAALWEEEEEEVKKRKVALSSCMAFKNKKGRFNLRALCVQKYVVCLVYGFETL